VILITYWSTLVCIRLYTHLNKKCSDKNTQQLSRNYDRISVVNCFSNIVLQFTSFRKEITKNNMIYWLTSWWGYVLTNWPDVASSLATIWSAVSHRHVSSDMSVVRQRNRTRWVRLISYDVNVTGTCSVHCHFRGLGRVWCDISCRSCDITPGRLRPAHTLTMHASSSSHALGSSAFYVRANDLHDSMPRIFVS